MKINTSLLLFCVTFLLTTTGIVNAKPSITHEAEFSATSYLSPLKPGNKYRSIMNINQSQNKVRYSYPKKKHQTTNIFRYDKGLIWNIHPEQGFYPGVLLYQEFKLTSGRGVNFHLDLIAQVKTELKDTKNIKTIGEETIEGVKTTHYQRRKPSLYHEGEFDISDYWISDNGVLVKMTYKGKEANGRYELKDIKFGSQEASLFEPPPGYEKRGNRISWKEELKKLKAKNK